MAEKRRLKRNIRRCETEFTHGEVSNRGIASDFSEDGLFIKTTRPVAPESVIDMMVYLPNGSVSRLKGMVKWSSRTPTGRVFGASGRARSARSGMGLELLEKDENYDLFIRSLHS